MQPQTVERLMSLYESIMQELSGDQPYSELVQELHQFLKLIGGALETVGTRESVIAVLQQSDEPSPEQLETVEAIAHTLLPLVYQLIKAAAKQGVKRLPSPPGGRPTRSTAKERQAICEEILGLIGKGVSPSDAKSRIGRRLGLSRKTMDRMWSERGNPVAQQFSPDEVMALLTPYLPSTFNP